MEILEIVDMMEESIDKAPVVPLSGKILVDREDLLDYIQEMRLVFPEELKEAKWVKSERERILSEAETRSQTMVKNAEDKVRQMIDENEITRQAVEQANQLVNEAQQKAMEMDADMRRYVNEILEDVEKRLDMQLKRVQDDLAYYNSKQ